LQEVHLDPETLARLACGDLASDELQRIERHLALCAVCQWRLEDLSAQVCGALAGWHGPPEDYDGAIDRALEDLSLPLAGAAEESGDAGALLKALLRAARPERPALIRGDVRFQIPKLCQLLKDRGREAWHEDPAVALEFAELAVAVAERLDPARFGSNQVEDTLASAWAHLGNAYRITSDLRRAEEALRRASVHHLRAGGDAFTQSEILSFTASLRDNQGRFDEATYLLDRVIAIHREGQENLQMARALITKGVVLNDAGRSREAIHVLREGMARLDPEEEPRLVLAARHNLIFGFNEIGESRRALAALEASRQLYMEVGDRLHRVRFWSLEGLISRNLGRLDEAAVALRRARDGFAESGSGIGAAVASLNLAVVHARQGRSGDVRRVTAEVIPILDANNLRQEAFLARLLFERAGRP
jgi:tetratricopeptide (TPR) repeat protein